MFVSAALLIAALPLAFAQVEQEPILSFSYPIARGNAGEVSNIAPCAGFAQGGRLEYPLTGGDVSITAIKDAKLLNFAYSTNADPQSVEDFTRIGGDFEVQHRGTTCLSFPDMAAAGLTAGQNVTLQMRWEAGPRNYVGYACADVTLVETPADVSPINYTCTTTYLSTQTRGNANPELTKLREAAASESAVESAKAMADAIWRYGPGGVSAPAAGGIGAGVTLTVVALVLIAGWATGAVAFGKRHAQALKQSNQHPIQETKSISSSV